MQNNPPAEKRNARLLLVSILLAALAVRVWGLAGYALNPHELQFVLIAEGYTFTEIWRRGLIELHPPLLHFLRHYLLLLDPDIFVQRLFSVAAGMLSVFGMYRLGLRLRGQALGVFCAFGMAFTMIAVSTSQLLRDYAFFTALLLAACLFFLRYQRRRKFSDLAGFTGFLFLASAMNFSGFLLAAACGLFEGWRLLKSREWKSLFFYCASFVPLAALALLLYFNYMAPGTAGPMWDRLAVVNGQAAPDLAGRLGSTLLEIYLFFVPFGGMRGLPTAGFAAGLAVYFMMLGSAGLLFLQAAGLRRMYREDRGLACFILTLCAVAVAASLVGFYPFSSSRRCCYLLPFVLLAYGYALEPLLQKLLLSSTLTRAAACGLVLAGVMLGQSGIYPGFADELSLTQKNLAAGQAYLAAHLHPGDAIVTGKIAAYFYLLEDKDRGKTAYNAYADFPYLQGSRVLAPFDPPFKPHAGWQPFRDDLATRLAAGAVPPGGKFWFVMYGWKSLEISRLAACPSVAPYMKDFFSLDDVLVFSLKDADLSAFLQDDAAWKKCFAGYVPSAVGVPFPQMARPL